METIFDYNLTEFEKKELEVDGLTKEEYIERRKKKAAGLEVCLKYDLAILASLRKDFESYEKYSKDLPDVVREHSAIMWKCIALGLE